jgi:hypothetical protein
MQLYWASDQESPSGREAWSPDFKRKEWVSASPRAALEGQLDTLSYPWHVWRVVVRPDLNALRKDSLYGALFLQEIVEVHDEIQASALYDLSHGTSTQGSGKVADILQWLSERLTSPAWRSSLIGAGESYPPSPCDLFPPTDLEAKYCKSLSKALLRSCLSIKVFNSPQTARLEALISQALYAYLTQPDLALFRPLTAPLMLVAIEWGDLQVLSD